MSRVLDAAMGLPWAITEPALSTILDVAAREGRSPESVERELGRRLENTRTVRVRDGVAVIPVQGPMFRYANLFTRISGATSYEDLATDIGAAFSDPGVRAVVLDIDSPGGMVDGVHEVAEMVYRGRGEKPTVAFVSGVGASAAYYIASGAERVLASPTAVVGGVGVVLRVLPDAKENELKFVSSQSPKKGLDPFAGDADERAAAHGELQSLVDGLARVFIATVAKNRGIKPETALAGYGQGGVLVGEAAVAAGMADGLTTLEELISEMSKDRRDGGSAGLLVAGGDAATGPSTQEANMPKKETGAGAAERREQPTVDRAYLDAHHAELVAEIAAEAKAAERKRILAIHALPASGFEAVKAELMADPKANAGDAALRLINARAEQERSGKQAHLDALAADERTLEAPAPNTEQLVANDAAIAARIMTAGKPPAQA